MIRLHLEMNSFFIHRKTNNKRYKALTACCEIVRFCGTQGLFGIIPWLLKGPQSTGLFTTDPDWLQSESSYLFYLVLNFEKINSLKLIVIRQVQIYAFVPSYSYTTRNLKPTAEILLQEMSLLLCHYMSWHSHEGHSRANKCYRKFNDKNYTFKKSSILPTHFPHCVFSLKIFSINSHINVLLSSVAISYSWPYEIPRVAFCNMGV